LAHRAITEQTAGEKIDDNVQSSMARQDYLHMEITKTLGQLHELELQCENLALPFSTRDKACQQIPAVLSKLEQLEGMIQPSTVIAGAEIDDFAMASAAAAG